MTTGSTAYLVDTNVLVYAYDPAEGDKRLRAIAVLRRLRARRSAAVSTQVLGEFYVVASRRLPHVLPPARAERTIMLFMRSWPVFGVTPLAVIEAVRGAQRFQMPYYDALIWATARLNGVPTVLSEDFNDGALLEGVRFRNPFQSGFDVAAL